MSIQAVSPATLHKWLDAGEAIAVDVREPREYAAEHIEGSALVPLGGLHAGALPAHSGKKLVILCRAGMRGFAGCQKLSAELPGTDIYNLEGGLIAWSAAGLPVARPAQKHGEPLFAGLMRFLKKFA